MGLYLAAHFTIEVMPLSRADALQIAEAALHQAGFQVSRRCSVRASCFDFAARDEERLFFAKVFGNIHDVSRGVADGIKTISGCFSSASLFLSGINEEDPLRDDTVYSRYDVHVVTLKTFEDVVLRGRFPLVKAARGGYSVALDGRKIRERRHELGLSIGKLAGMVGVSRRTLYGYERGLTRASVSTAYQLGKVLGVPVAETVDIFETPLRGFRSGSSSVGGCDDVRGGFLGSILSKLTQFGLKVLPTNRAPFDFTADCPREEFKIVGGVFRRKEPYLEERVREILSLSAILRAKTLFLGEERTAVPEDVAFLNYDELAGMRDREELTALL